MESLMTYEQEVIKLCALIVKALEPRNEERDRIIHILIMRLVHISDELLDDHT